MENNEQEKIPLKAIIFDLDNTLIPTRKIDEEACSICMKWLTEQGFEDTLSKSLCDQFLQQYRAHPFPPWPYSGIEILDKWRKDLWLNVLPEEKSSLCGQLYFLWKKRRFEGMSLPPSIKEMLKTLKQSYKLALVSNGDSTVQWEKINESAISQYFDLILISGDVNTEKPDVSIFQMAFKHLKVLPSECIIVGDKICTDICGGKNANLAATVWLQIDKNEIPSIKPDFTIHDTNELSSVILNIVN